ncbi:hypothetical protein V6N11_070653 [Hibiscus sabdariffa]|uniref:Uncharacterized protein n=1 Tax=Hibiscus sabdariffa TaxID=183260 RepID=A0ABR2QFN2_9ROSI
MSQNLKGIQTNQEACSTDKKPSYREIVKRNLEEYGSEASSSHIADTAEPSNREEKSSSDKVYKRVIGHIEEETLWKLGRCLIAGGSEGIKVHCRDSLEVTEDSSSEVAGKSPGAKVQTCVQMKMKRQRSGITAFMSDQNGGQNEIYSAENNGSVQVSKKDGAVEDTISEDLQELQGENNRSSWEIRGRRKHQTLKRSLSFVDVATSWLSVLRMMGWLVKLSSRHGGEGL